MARKTALALVIASAAAVSAFAEDGTYQPDPFTSMKSRADVLSELQEARRSGVNPWADEYNPVMHMRSDRSREEVTRDYLSSRDSVSAFGGEDSGSVYLGHREATQPQAAQLAVAPAPGIEE
ncbi:DUF4148 domain-containing protein [Ramlibacter sp. USB13]|uniref:DUF4148 domain-containing protein n=1 Tax=Ramlibacter cellulosilyticus TaxID=2764187 RepID=A0A923MUL8_9BURK|nr:DUF4148 domain-containing protein [Ramlibacter cellulosilyticus]MBC5786167.1 DUF4148 domain-containing protein [Ramlibacter cellulosilyticus]